MLIELDNRELAHILEVCERDLADLRVEVRRTSTPDYHDSLVVQRDRLQALVEKLRESCEVTVD